jgi:outer membrane receptor protein involved in Fe transport
VDRIEVVRGANGDLYGADALGGVIQVLTLDADRPRLRVLFEGGSQDTFRTSGFGGVRSGAWSFAGGAEVQRTDGAYIVAADDRGAVDTRADSDYQSGFGSVGYAGHGLRATVRGHVASEDRGNGTPLQVNDTQWRQVSGDLNGALAGGLWTARVSGGTQDYFQTFSAIAADRQSERLTNDQTIPGTFFAASGQWLRAWRRIDVLAGLEARHTSADINEVRYPVTGAPVATSLADVSEDNYSVFGRVKLALRDDLSLVLGGRGDQWDSTESVGFFSPRAALTWRANDLASVQFSVSRAYRTPTLNELYRGFRVGNIVTNANPLLEPETLTGVEGGVLTQFDRASVRATAFFNNLDGAIANVTLSQTPTAIVRQRQNSDAIRATGLEIEVDTRFSNTLSATGQIVLTSSHFRGSVATPAIEGNDVPQVPNWQGGFSVTWADPRLFTAATQVRFSGDQWDDDLNTPAFELQAYAVWDATVSRAIVRSVHAFLAVENILDKEFDTARTPIRSIGWPRTVRVGARVTWQ